MQEGHLRQASASDYGRLEWLQIYVVVKKEAEQNDDNDGGDDTPSSDNNEWEVKLAEGVGHASHARECREVAYNERRFDWICSDLECEGKLPDSLALKFDRLYHGNNSRDRVIKLKKLYDGKPITFEIDTNKPNGVTLTYPNGSIARVCDKVMYESVLQSA